MKEDRFHILMFKSLDGTMAPGEQQEFDRLLLDEPVFKAQFEQLVQTRKGLEALSIPENERWSDAEVDQLVSRAMEKQEAVILALGRHWQKIAVACVLALLASIGSIYQQSGTLDSDTLVGIEEIEAEEAYTYLNTNYTYDE